MNAMTAGTSMRPVDEPSQELNKELPEKKIF